MRLPESGFAWCLCVFVSVGGGGEGRETGRACALEPPVWAYGKGRCQQRLERAWRLLGSSPPDSGREGGRCPERKSPPAGLPGRFPVRPGERGSGPPPKQEAPIPGTREEAGSLLAGRAWHFPRRPALGLAAVARARARWATLCSWPGRSPSALFAQDVPASLTGRPTGAQPGLGTGRRRGEEERGGVRPHSTLQPKTQTGPGAGSPGVGSGLFSGGSGEGMGSAGQLSQVLDHKEALPSAGWPALGPGAGRRVWEGEDRPGPPPAGACGGGQVNINHRKPSALSTLSTVTAEV